MIAIREYSGRGFIEREDLCDGCWVDARSVSNMDLVRLEKEFGISQELLTDLMDADEQSRIEQEDEYTAFIVRVPVYDISLEIIYYTVPLGIILFPNKIITVCQSSSAAIDDMVNNRFRGFQMKKQSAFVLHVLGRAAAAYLKALKELNRNANNTELELRKSVQNRELIQLLSIQKSLVFFTTSLQANSLVLEKMKKSPFLRLQEEEQDLLDDVITDNMQATEMANIYSSILTGTMDAFASVISNNMNIVMKRLAMINIVLMIPTLIYSFYGMNIDLPLQHHPLSLIFILGLSLVISTLGVVLLNANSSAAKRVSYHGEKKCR
ncbi:MAG: magnesium transporter CorA family protein [Spirochaetaceae bacterium]|jgi:magnesium transporter|nr:magnesium transporter CorA family protein [Spirochaetaceae bacterium]